MSNVKNIHTGFGKRLDFSIVTVWKIRARSLTRCSWTDNETAISMPVAIEFGHSEMVQDRRLRAKGFNLGDIP